MNYLLLSSRGELCNVSLTPKNPLVVDEAFEKLFCGDFKINKRSRLQITLIDSKGVSRVIPLFALNEVFSAENDPSRPSVHSITINSQPPFKCRSSGVLVASGSGSTAWMKHASALSHEQVASVLAEIDQLKNISSKEVRIISFLFLF